MKKFAIVILSLTATFSALAQTKTVTNQDLEKYRQQRIAADRDLKEKYAEMGTTAEEVDKRNRERRAAMEQYSDQLLTERIALENARRMNELNNRIDALNAQMAYNNQNYYPGYFYPGVYGYGYPYAGYGGNRFLFRHLNNLPPNARFVQGHTLMYPNTPGYNQQFNRRINQGFRSGFKGGGIRGGGGTVIGGGVRFGGGGGVRGGGFIISGGGFGGGGRR